MEVVNSKWMHSPSGHNLFNIIITVLLKSATWNNNRGITWTDKIWWAAFNSPQPLSSNVHLLPSFPFFLCDQDFFLFRLSTFFPFFFFSTLSRNLRSRKRGFDKDGSVDCGDIIWGCHWHTIWLFGEGNRENKDGDDEGGEDEDVGHGVGAD